MNNVMIGEVIEDKFYMQLVPELEQMIREIHAELCGEKEELCEIPKPNGVGVSFSEGSVNFFDGEKIVHCDPSKNVKLSAKLRDVYFADNIFDEDKQAIKDAISIIEQYETIPDGHVMTIYNPDEYMIVERVK
jgi:hypothetical protein